MLVAPFEEAACSGGAPCLHVCPGNQMSCKMIATFRHGRTGGTSGKAAV